ncbi:MAG: hypothetical protein ACLUPV_07725 [Bilophila wadsworthia]
MPVGQVKVHRRRRGGAGSDPQGAMVLDVRVVNEALDACTSVSVGDKADPDRFSPRWFCRPPVPTVLRAKAPRQPITTSTPTKPC